MEDDTFLPPPPEGGPCGGQPTDNLETLMESLNQHAGENGYALIRRNGANYRDGKPTSYAIFCDRGSQRASEGRGARASTSRKLNCTFKGKVRALMKDDWRWSFQLLNSEHNHGPSQDKTAHPVLRRLTKEHQRYIGALARNGIRIQEIQSSFAEDFPGHPLTAKDINNCIQKMKKTRSEAPK